MKGVSNKRCVVCEAKIPSKRLMNPKTSTCSVICTKAKKEGVSREQAMAADPWEDMWAARRRYL